MRKDSVADLQVLVRLDIGFIDSSIFDILQSVEYN